MFGLLDSKITWFALGILVATFITVIPSTIKKVV